MNTPEEASAYLQEIRLPAPRVGNLRLRDARRFAACDANVNIHVPLTAISPLSPGGGGAGREGILATPIVEIKNLNSIRGVERALKYEANRQAAGAARKTRERRMATWGGWENTEPLAA